MPSVPPLPSRAPNTASDERGYQRIRLRQDTASNWLKNDPVLASGELGYVIGHAEPGQVLKVGDGTRRWSELPYLAARGPSGPAGIGVQGPQGRPGQSVTVFDQTARPVANREGDLWLESVEAKDAPEEDSVAPNQGFVGGMDFATEPWVRDYVASILSDPETVQSITEKLTSKITEVIREQGLTAGISEEQTRRIFEDLLLDPKCAATNEFKEWLASYVGSRLTGGKRVPPDTAWTVCPQVAGAGVVEARVLNGILYLRGSVTITTNKWTHLRNLPIGFTKPSTDYQTLCVGGESGVAERVCAAFVNTQGQISISTFGLKITDVSLGGERARYFD